MIKNKLRFFSIPFFVLATLISALFFHEIFKNVFITNAILSLGILVGSYQLIRDSYVSLKQKSFALDYIAILAIMTGLITGNFFVAGVIVLMMAGGNTLEIYAQALAQKSLTSLSNRIPHEVLVSTGPGSTIKQSITSVEIGSQILVRKGEVVPLDGKLESESAELDESSLTGEPYPVTRKQGELLRSGVVNRGESLIITTTVADQNSTYRKIIKLVEAAQQEKPPFLQAADRLSGWFTLVAILLAGTAYGISADLNRALAVLVIATPCPLILAAPIAMIGGMNAAAKQRIIFKRLAALEVLAQVNAMIFDKTGTLTFGIPKMTGLQIINNDAGTSTEKQILAIASGLEKHSLHPFAKAIVSYSEEKDIASADITEVTELLGKGITGKYHGDTYSIRRGQNRTDSVSLFKGKQPLAHFQFTDVLKPSTKSQLTDLQNQNISLHIFTGDSTERASELEKQLPSGITIKAELSPEEKRNGIAAIRKKGITTAMVGDGINDAPALALADVGIVFSHEEHTAASEAADVVLLGGNITGIATALKLARHTIFISKQSMYIGLGLSCLGMVIAAFGGLPPIFGAISQEVIDVAVILNALRAATPKLRAIS